MSSEERGALQALTDLPARRVQPRHDLLREGEPIRALSLVLDGWGIRYKMLEDGRRQIVALFLPGDLCDAHSYLLRQADHSIGTLTRMRVVEIPPERFEELVGFSGRLRDAVRWHELTNVAMQREWTLNLGQRTAFERIGHFLCETFVRLQSIGLTQGDSCDFPIVQNDLADITGLTSVHVNRTLQELRRLNLIRLETRRLTIPNLKQLKDATQFNDNYLHLHRDGAHLDANG